MVKGREVWQSTKNLKHSVSSAQVLTNSLSQVNSSASQNVPSNLLMSLKGIYYPQVSTTLGRLRKFSHSNNNSDQLSLAQCALFIKIQEAGVINFNELLEQSEQEPLLIRPCLSKIPCILLTRKKKYLQNPPKITKYNTNAWHVKAKLGEKITLESLVFSNHNLQSTFQGQLNLLMANLGTRKELHEEL